MGAGKQKYVIVIAGPTAVGKTEIAIKVAKELQTEIISADARQLYKEMDIGTAKPDKTRLSEIKHHFINSLSVHDNYDAGKYETDVIKLLHNLFMKYNSVVLTGGSGLFIKAVTDGLDTLPPADFNVRNNLKNLLAERGIESLRQLLEIQDPEYYKIVDLRRIYVG
jgi:tRNA dimethylallyltransferase